MPRKYKRKTQKAAWTAESLQAAINAIEGGRALREVARSYNIPRATLQDRRRNGNLSKPRLGRKPVFSQDQENSLVEQVINLSKLFFGITPAQIKQSAYTFAKMNNLKNPFTQKNDSAGRDWLEGFLRRNPQICLRKPESTSVNRVTAFNKEEVSIFYRNLNNLMDKYKFLPARIFNADETGITTVQRPSKIYAKKGQKRVGYLTSWEKGKTTTVMCAFSATGIYVPPMFIYARKRMAPHLMKNGPPGAIYHCSDNGWITEELFIEWLKHFDQYTKPSTKDPLLLLLDNHFSHCSLKAYNFCKERGIHMLTIPPHTSHRMQPLDVTFYGPLKAAYNSECDKYMRSHPGEKITPNEVAELFNKAFGRVATLEKATKGFEVTGIYPTNPDIFSEEDFAPAENLRPHIFTPAHNLNPSPPGRSTTLMSTGVEEQHGSQTEESIVELMENRQLDEGRSNSVSFNEIIPIPGCSQSTNKTKQNTSNKKQHSVIFTSTPMKEVLEEKENEKQKKRNKENEPRAKKVKRQVFASTSGISNEAKIPSNQNKPMLREKIKPVDYQEDDVLEESDKEDIGDRDITNDICIICGEFGKNRELWLRCVMCGGWAHKDCTSGENPFICDFCQ